MPVNTLTVATAVTPTVIETAILHYLKRRPLRQKPTAHISYHEGLELIRRFLYYASFHTVEELQAFTSQWVPVPHWVHVEEVEIVSRQLLQSADLIQAQLGPKGIEQVGGKTWWQWRLHSAPLKAEWVEMRKDYDARNKAGGQKSHRIMLYVHGGAYYFGSVDEHRYQMQRHARKLKARVLAPRYRLAPQFPFPCGLQDCLAAYLYLLDQGYDPSTIILAGDSAGGGMVLSILVILRDQGVPLPAGAILISPWVDLTHSFPSLGGDGQWDYIPAHGFVHKPSLSWPPPNADDLASLERRLQHKSDVKESPRASRSKSANGEHDLDKATRVRGFSVEDTSQRDREPGSEEEADEFFVSADGSYSIGPRSHPILSVKLDGKRVQIKEQIQMYAPNHLLTHPLVSPVLQPTLGGLPPLLIQTGGGELLHDEQVYLAHKVAQPLAYIPPPSNHQTATDIEAQASKYRPTNVQLQVWEDLCHVAPTLSFTRPAKYMYRSIGQFGAWALARAQKTSIDILDDDSISFVSTDTSDSSSTSSQSNQELSSADIKLAMPQSAQHVGFESVATKTAKSYKVGRAGDPLPAFENYMIRQRVDRHGNAYPLAPASDLPALQVPGIEIGVPKPGPLSKWMARQEKWNGKFAKEKLKVQKRRLEEMQKGYEVFEGEKPPPTALAGRRLKQMKVDKPKKKSWGMAMWSLWGSKHDEATLVREEKADQVVEENISFPAKPDPTDGSSESKSSAGPSKPIPKTRRKSKLSTKALSRSRSQSRRTDVTDRGQMTPSTEDINRLAPPIPGFAEATRIAPEREASYLQSPRSESGPISAVPTPSIAVEDTSRPQSPETLIPATDTFSTRPTRGGVAYPFRLSVEGGSRDVNASTVTLASVSVGDEDTGAEASAANEPGPVKETGSATDDRASRTSLVGEDVHAGAHSTNEPAADNQSAPTTDEKTSRPAPERFVTASSGDLSKATLPESDTPNHEVAQRPGIERFETAHSALGKAEN